MLNESQLFYSDKAVMYTHEILLPIQDSDCLLSMYEHSCLAVRFYFFIVALSADN
jgi:hypothetical protein